MIQGSHRNDPAADRGPVVAGCGQSDRHAALARQTLAQRLSSDRGWRADSGLGCVSEWGGLGVGPAGRRRIGAALAGGVCMAVGEGAAGVGGCAVGRQLSYSNHGEDTRET